MAGVHSKVKKELNKVKTWLNINLTLNEIKPSV